MPYSLYTGLIYLLSCFVFIFGAYKFHKVWEQGRNFVSKIFSWLFIFVAVANFLHGIVVMLIFFVKPELFYLTIVDRPIIFAVPMGIFGYLAVFLWYPRISPKWGFIFSFSACFIVGLFNIIPPILSFLSTKETIPWERNLVLGICGSLAFVIPAIWIVSAFYLQAMKTDNQKIKIRAACFGTACLIGHISAGIGVFFANFMQFNPFFADLGMAVVSLILFLVLLLVPSVGQVPYTKLVE